MQPNIEELTSELIKLSKKDRLEIARFLLFLDNRPENPSDTDSIWENEILDRVRAVDEGRAVGMDFASAMKKIEKRLIR